MITEKRESSSEMKVKHGTISEVLSVLPPKTRLNDVAAIGPLVWYPAQGMDFPGTEADDRIWAATLAVSVDTKQGPQLCLVMAKLGLVGHAVPEELVAACDTVLIVKRAGELTRGEAHDVYEDLVNDLRKRFAGVHVFESELEYVRFCAERWPGRKVQCLLEAMTADPGA